MAELTGYMQVNLATLVEEIGEQKVKAMLSNFHCPRNLDIEEFIRYKAIEFSKQGTAKTHLVYTSYKDKVVLIGYYALTIQPFDIKKSANLSSNMRKRISRFAKYDDEYKLYRIPAPLIGQLGKNFDNNYNDLITGDELLAMACKRIQDMQKVFGGKVAFLECEDIQGLVAFYERNRFKRFDNRNLAGREREKAKVPYYVQMVRYFETS